jgi:hypothetical protein
MSRARPLGVLKDMRFESFFIVVVWSLSLACRGAVVDDSQERCDDTTAQIDEALRSYIDAAFLLPDALPCELTPESFDARVRPEDLERVLGQFRAACEQQQACCSGACLPRETPAADPPESVPPPAAPPPYVSADSSPR